MPDLHSTGRGKSGTKIDEQANCKVSEDVILPSAEIHISGADTQPDSNNADVKIKNETHGLMIYNTYYRFLKGPLQRAGPTMPKLSAKPFKES